MLHQGIRGAQHFHKRLSSPKAHAAHRLQHPFDRATCLDLADTAPRLARQAGATYADIRLGRNQRESLFARELRLQSASYGLEAGFGVRVLMNGS